MTADADERRRGLEPEVSTFALDVYWAAGQSGDPSLDAHVAGCDRCRAYLCRLDALSPHEARAFLDEILGVDPTLNEEALDGLGADYFTARSAMIGAVTLDGAKRVAKRLLDNGMLVTVVGKPAGVASTTAN